MFFDGSGGGRPQAWILNSSGYVRIGAGSGNKGSLTELADGTPFIARFDFDDMSSGMRIEPDGGTVQSETGLAPGTQGFENFFLLAGGSFAFRGKIAEMVLTDGTVRDRDDALVRSFLSSKHNIVHS